MTLKTLNKCTWKEIEVGEVFALNGCWMIFYKTSKNRGRVLVDDSYNWGSICECNLPWLEIWNTWSFKCFTLYKLPLSTQRLWRQDT